MWILRNLLAAFTISNWPSIFQCLYLDQVMKIDKEIQIKKRGAGLLFFCEGAVMILKRSSKKNNNKWDMPGGNLDMEDKTSYEGALREATEEIGSVPPHEVVGEFHITRGGGSKVFDVFLCEMSSTDRDEFIPKLNQEHSAWEWCQLDRVKAMVDLHPWIKGIFRQYPGELERSINLKTGN